MLGTKDQVSKYNFLVLRQERGAILSSTASTDADLKIYVAPAYAEAVARLESLVNTLLVPDKSTEHRLLAFSFYAEQVASSLSRAASESQRLVDKLNTEVTEIVVAQKQANDYLKQTNVCLEQWRKYVSTLTEQKNRKEQEQTEAMSALLNAENTYRDAEKALEDAKREKRTVRNVGAALLFVPFVGLIAGGTMIAISLSVLRDSVKASQFRVNTMKDQMKCTADSIVEIQENIEQYHTDLQRRQAERDALQKTADTLNKTVIYYKAELKRLASLDESMKKCSNYMTCTAGAGKVLSSEAHAAYAIERLLKPLKELANRLNYKISIGVEIHPKLEAIQARIDLICKDAKMRELEYTKIGGFEI